MFRIRGPAYYWAHDRFVNFDDTDPARATGLVLSHAETSPDGRTSLAAMRYEGEYRRAGQRWRFARRTIHLLYYMPASDYRTVFSSAARVHAGGQILEADYPENLARWKRFAEQSASTPAA